MSRSTVATVRPSAAAIVAKFRTVVLFATPPLVLATTIFFGLLMFSTCQTVRGSAKKCLLHLGFARQYKPEYCKLCM